MMLSKVLVVDDEHGVRESIRMLLKGSYDVTLAINGHDAIAKLPQVQPEIVLLDLRMPDMTGIEVLEALKTLDPSVEVILVTAYATVDTARKALRLGAFDYITKPFNPAELDAIVRRAIEHRNEQLLRSAKLEAMEQGYLSLRREVEEAKTQLATHVRDTVFVLLRSLEVRDAYSGQHSMAVLWLVDQFAAYLGMSATARQEIRRAALVHDLGKIGIPEDILNKPGPLIASEWAAMKNHPVLSSEIICSVEALSSLAPIVRAHHERWDGTGYPAGLAGDEIPTAAQVLAICDTVHAMSSDRCYRTRLPEAVVRRELLDQRGRQFNADLVEALLASPLLSEVTLAIENGKLTFNSEQVREVLGETADCAIDPVYPAC
jgi:putative two-component system response regulator